MHGRLTAYISLILSWLRLGGRMELAWGRLGADWTEAMLVDLFIVIECCGDSQQTLVSRPRDAAQRNR